MVPCDNQVLYPAFFLNATICIEANLTSACSLCFELLCSNCVRENHHVCHQNTNGDEDHIMNDTTAMVTWIINRLHASNKYIATIQTKKTAYNLSSLLRCRGNPALTNAACSYWGRLCKSGQNFGNILETIKVGRETSNSKLQLVLSSESTFDPSTLIPSILNVVKSKKTLQQVIGASVKIN